MSELESVKVGRRDQIAWVNARISEHGARNNGVKRAGHSCAGRSTPRQEVPVPTCAVEGRNCREVVFEYVACRGSGCVPIGTQFETLLEVWHA